MSRATERSILAGLIVFAAVVFLIGINWGLPSRRADPFLFGDHPIWTGEQIDRLAPPENPNVGADVDANPILNRDQPVVLNDTDAKRAEIVRRYRLFSYQPDEMITFKSLSRIRQFHGDPRLYQYGGLWIYPVGGMLKAASIVHLVDLRADRIYYLDHPEAFGRFYIVARVYVVLWGLVGVWAIFWIAKRLSKDIIVASAASVCYALMPVVVNMAHEAKPHLPGAVLVLLAIIAGTKSVETRRWKWALIAGALCGAAFGMVLSALLGFVVLPMMVLLVEAKWSKRIAVLVASTAVGLAVYVITNPFVVKHLLTDPQMLKSNLGNSSAMYQAPFSASGFLNAMYLIGDGATPVLAILGVFGIVAMIRKQSSLAWLLIAAMLMVLVQFVLLATGKPGEYARFSLVPDIVLAIAAVIAIGSLAKAPLRIGTLVVACLLTSVWGAGYVWHFARDSMERSTRIVAAERLAKYQTHGGKRLLIDAEPAPYSVPPVDLFKWTITLRPRVGAEPRYDVAIRAVDFVENDVRSSKTTDIEYWIRPRLLSTPLSWASKPFEVSTLLDHMDDSDKISADN